MYVEPLNTLPIQQYLQQVKAADFGKQKEVRIDIATAKTLAYTLGMVMARLEGDLEKLVKESKEDSNETIIVKVDSGSNW